MIQKQKNAALEIIFYAAVCTFVIWSDIPSSNRFMTILTGGILVFYPILSNLIQKQTWRQMGLDPTEFWTGMRSCTILCLTLGPVLFLMARKTGFVLYNDQFTMQYGAWCLPGSVTLFFLLYPVFGLFQQFIFLGFIFSRLETIFNGNQIYAASGCVLLFVASHIPNPTLMVVTLFAGTLFVVLFIRQRNYLPIAVIHGVLGGLLFFILQRFTHSLAVGKTYLLYR